MIFSKLLQDSNVRWLTTVVKPAAIVFAAVISVYTFYKWREGPYYTKPYRLDGKVAIVTGCNTGIGKEIALDFVRRGATVYMACRNYEKCEQARLEIISKTGRTHVFNRTLDLASLESVRKFVETFLLEESRLDILVNNAGILSTPRTLTQDGFELQLGVNHLGHFLLTNLLLDILKSSAPSRIVVVTSLLHFIAAINRKDLHGECSYSRTGAYAQSKLANILFTVQLAKLLEGTEVTVNCLHPGVVRTEIWRNNNLFRLLSFLFSRIILRSPQGGAQTALYLAIDPDVAHKSGDYYDRMKVARTSRNAKSRQMAEWLWAESEKLVGLVTETS